VSVLIKEEVIGWERERAALTVIAKYMHEAFVERYCAATPALAQGRRSYGAWPSSGVER